MQNLRQALNRATYGVTDELLQQAQTAGWASWVAHQLTPATDAGCEERIRSTHFKIKKTKVAVSQYFEDAQTLVDRLAGEEKPADFSYNRPAWETALATWTRALHSEFQVQELLVEFWHNHFNVSIEADQEIALLFGVHDREVIRKHALGNFREFLEAVATSPAMLYYLDNVHSKASPANENYARELFELHTMGADAYKNHVYTNWKEVPGALDGMAEGYIDEDVYEAARAFTGWAVGHGNKRKGHQFPRTGAFYYCDQWHDHYQKRILGREFKSHQPAMADGRAVLDMVANHPATAKHVCAKLCRWWVGDNPPDSIVEKAISTWTAHAQASDQIAQTVKTILLSTEFEAGLGQKVKRPNQLLFSFARQLGVPFPPSKKWKWLLEGMGYRQFAWPTPTGHPDNAGYWTSTDMMLKRWNSIPDLLWLNKKAGNRTVLTAELESLPNLQLDTVLDFWAMRLLGRVPTGTIRTALKAKLLEEMQDLPNEDLYWLHPRNAEGWAHKEPQTLEYVLMQLVSLLALMPEFQKR